VEAPPPLQLASAAPTSAAPRPAATTALKPISREPPDFPKEAIADGYKSGIVNARIHVDARGSVTGVDIMGSQPPKVFDRAARRALLRWQFEPNAAGQPADLDVDVKFQRD
jgi:protein TonB